MKTTLRSLAPFIILALVGTAAGCGGDDDTTGSGGSGGTGGSGGSGGSGGATGDAASDTTDMLIASSTGDWEIYRDPYLDGGASPISAMQGKVEAFWSGAEMKVKLTVSGLPPNRPFGSHVHRLECNDGKAGTHYQNEAAPDGGLTDPKYANSMNEVWLDFTTDATGAGSAEAKVAWRPRAGEAKAVVIHDQLTKNDGTAGAKLACIGIPF